MIASDEKMSPPTEEQRLRFETLISDLSAQFVKLASHQVHGAIELALERVRRFFDCDRCALLGLSVDRRLIFVRQASYGEGIEPVAGDIDLAALFPWGYQQLVHRGKNFIAARLSDLPAEAEQDRQSCLAIGICSFLTIPLFASEGVHSIITIQAAHQERDWPEEYVPRLRLLGDLFVNALERRDTDEALRQSESRLRLATEAAGAGLWSIDLSTSQAWVTEKVRDLFGLTDHGTLNLQSFMERIHPDERDLVLEAMRQSLGSGEEFQVDFRILAADGSLRWISSRGCPEPGSEKGLGRLTGISLDATGPKRQESEARLHLEELAHLSRLSTVGELTTSLAHELNQPLGAILRNAEAAELHLQADEPDLEELRAIVADIRQDDERAGQVIQRLRRLLKRHKVELAPLSLGPLVTEVVGLVRSSAVDRRIRLETDLPADLPRVCGDRVHLQQVLLNLILNGMDAIDRTPREDRRVAIRARPAGDGTVEVAVSDSGGGVAPEQVNRLFDPFFTTKASGMGMGLPISRTIIEAHKGKIYVENGAAGGASFRFTLPIAAGGEQ